MHSAHLYGAAKLPHPDSDVAGDRKSCAAPANAEPKLICISNRDHASAGKRRGQDPRFAAQAVFVCPQYDALLMHTSR